MKRIDVVATIFSHFIALYYRPITCFSQVCSVVLKVSFLLIEIFKIVVPVHVYNSFAIVAYFPHGFPFISNSCSYKTHQEALEQPPL